MPARAPGRATLRLLATSAAAALLLVAVAGCGVLPGSGSGEPGITGEGEVQTETRDLAPFTRVSVAAGMKLIVGEASTQEVTVSAQPNILPLIKTEVVDGQLIVTLEAEGGVTATQPMSLSIKIPVIESVALSAGAVGYVEHTGGELVLDVSAGAELTAIGDTPDLRLTATTGSHAKLGELVAQDAQIRVNDGATVEVNVTGTLSGVADGGSSVILAVKPATVDVETSSGATIQGG
jgi:hypothetical protein